MGYFEDRKRMKKKNFLAKQKKLSTIPLTILKKFWNEQRILELGMIAAHRRR